MTPTYPGTGQPMTAGVLADGTTLNHLTEHGRLVQVWENVKHYGAVGDGVTNDATAIDAAITAAAVNRGTVYFPPGSYLRGTSRMAVPDGVNLMGAGSHTSKLYWNGTLTDSCIYAARRDDNNANNFDVVSIRDLGVDLQSVAAMSGVACLDVTGFRNSTFERLYLNGKGIGSGGVMIRLADRNPAATSQKSTFFNSIRNIEGSGSGWGTGVRIKQVDGNCNSNQLEQLNCYCAVGFDFTGNIGSLTTRIASVYFAATGTATDIVGALSEQQNVDFAQMDFEGYTTNNLPAGHTRIRNVASQQAFHSGTQTTMYTEYKNSNGKTALFGIASTRPFIHCFGTILLEGWGDTGVGESPGIRINSLALIMSGTGAPNTVVTAPVGSLWLRSDGGANSTLYVKESGTGNTGWVGK